MAKNLSLIDAVSLDQALASIGDSVRTKGNTTSKFNSPQEMKNAIDNLQVVNGAIAHIYKGSSGPTPDLGFNGDIYLKKEEISPPPKILIDEILPEVPVFSIGKSQFCSGRIMANENGEIILSDLPFNPHAVFFYFSVSKGSNQTYFFVSAINDVSLINNCQALSNISLDSDNQIKATVKPIKALFNSNSLELQLYPDGKEGFLFSPIRWIAFGNMEVTENA